MAFVRKVRTGSGATAVQVVQKRHGKLEIIKHFGSGYTPVEVALLVQRGRGILQGEQEALDLGVAAEADTALARAVEEQPSLLPDSTPPAAGPVACGQGVHVLGTSSDVLWSTLRAAYARLGFGVLEDEVFEQVVLARLVEPTSKLDTIRVLEGLGVRPPHHTTISRHLRQAQDRPRRGSRYD
ncbi:hypothetical protein [Brachybacterium vulturis]|uniref:hypothetical protein n=1 Tax=Brachybacterium vulturis TaxID=2017484 RepID=UPI003736075F